MRFHERGGIYLPVIRKTGRYIQIASHTGRYIQQIAACCLNGICCFQQFLVARIAKADSNNKNLPAPFSKVHHLGNLEKKPEPNI